MLTVYRQDINESSLTILYDVNVKTSFQSIRNFIELVFIMGGIKFDLDNDVPELSEKVILITGGTFLDPVDPRRSRPAVVADAHGQEPQAWVKNPLSLSQNTIQTTYTSRDEMPKMRKTSLIRSRPRIPEPT